MKLFFLIPLLLIIQIDSARHYLYVRETSENRGVEIDRWNREVGNRVGSSWCAAFSSAMIRPVSKLQSGSAVKFITRNSITANEALRGKPIPPGSLVIWRKGNELRGHVEIVVEWHKDHGTTIGGNTGSNLEEGDGVYVKQRKIKPFEYQRIVAFTPIP
jgi:hypothetical protein